MLTVVALIGAGTFGTIAVHQPMTVAAGNLRPPATSLTVTQQGTTLPTRVEGDGAGRIAKAPASVRGSAPHLLVPILAYGDTRLADSVQAVRTDSGVTVYFDISMLRTRRADKFERFVRATLPEIYGPAMDSLLALVPEGTFIRQGDLIVDLPSRGARVALPNGWRVTVWPETRQGYDGPLVVRYRVLVDVAPTASLQKAKLDSAASAKSPIARTAGGPEVRG